jgi:hypothetical protein
MIKSGQSSSTTIDEVRVANVNFSDAWVDFEYHNIAESDNELMWGAEELYE